MGVNGIYGLSGSGLDIESMVKVGMMSRQNEYDKMAQKYTLNEWKKANYIELNNQITTFNMSSLTDYKLTSTMKAKTATSSNEAAVTASSNANAATMNHKVSVQDLSHNAYFIGSNRIANIIKATQGITESEALAKEGEAKLSDILFKGLTYGSKTITSNYTSATVSGNTTTYPGDSGDSGDSGDGLITSTTITRNSGSNRVTIQYKGVNDKTAETYYGTEATTLTREKKETTFSASLFSSNIKLESTVENGKTINASFTYDEKTYSAAATGGLAANSTITFTATDGSTLSAGTGSNGAISSITIPNTSNFPFGPSATTYNAGRTDTKETYTESTISFNDNTAQIVVRTTKDGNENIISNTATTTAKEDGVTGNTLANNGERKDIGWDFAQGKHPMVQKGDTALAFTIADKDNATSKIEIKVTYDQLLGDNTDPDKSPFTMNDLISEIKTQANAKNINIKAEYDNINGIFSIYNSNGNDESRVIIEAVNSNQKADGTRTYEGRVTMGFLNALGLKEFNGSTLESAQTLNSQQGGTFTAKGSTGTITVDGMEYKTQDNKVTVGGVTYTALSSTKDATGVDRPATVTVGQDVDAIIGKVKSFVESYNKILGSLYEKYDEKNDSNYKPLTQSQKDSMKEEQIEKWEEKAKKGMLYHDSTLSSIIGQMRNAITSSVEVDGQEYSVFGIGISTTGLKGQLKLDEEKLRNAINENGDAVYNVFSKLTTKTENGKEVTDYGKSGVAQRLGDIFTNATKLIKSRAGSSTDISEDSELNNLLRELQTKMSNFRKLMNAFEDKLYKKYDAMEVALSRLGTQMNFITGGQ